jgi:hypothetical protein
MTDNKLTAIADMPILDEEPFDYRADRDEVGSAEAMFLAPSPVSPAAVVRSSGAERDSTAGIDAASGEPRRDRVVRSREERSEAAKRGWSTRRSKDAFK